MAGFYFDACRGDLWAAKHDTAQAYKMMLVSAIPARSAAKRSDIANEIAGAGYTAGGTAVTLTPSLNAGAHIESITHSQAQWVGVTIPAGVAGGVVYRARGGAATADEVVGFVEITGGVSGVGITYMVPQSAFTETNT
jgi:hypothetical protein